MIPHEVDYDYAFCKRCNRKLHDEISIDRGYGPVCWEKVQKETVNQLAKNKFTMNAKDRLIDECIFCGKEIDVENDDFISGESLGEYWCLDCAESEEWQHVTN